MIRHKKVSPKPDGDDPSRVNPTDWNEEHDVDGFVGALLLLAVAQGVPYLDDDGNPAVAPLSDVGRQLLAMDGIPTLLSVLEAAPIDSPVFLNNPRAPTQAIIDNSTRLATTEFVQALVAALVGSAPETLNTLSELAAAINNQPDFAATVLAALANRLRVDDNQGLSPSQKAMGLANLGVIIGTAANNVLKLDGAGKLPAVDGSQLVNVTPGAGALRFDTAQALTDAEKQQARTNAGGIGALEYINITQSVAAGALTLSIKDIAGNDFSAASALNLNFRNSTLASGAQAVAQIAGPLSITIPSGQAVGAVAAKSFRLWVVGIDNAGTVELAVIKCATATDIVALLENQLISTTAIAAAPSAGVFYSAAARASKAMRIIGYVEWDGGLATPGTWIAPTGIQVFGPGVKLPGDPLQVASVRSGGSSTSSLTMVDVTGAAKAITPTSKCNAVLIGASWDYSTSIIASQLSGYLARFLREATPLNSPDTEAHAHNNGGGNACGGFGHYTDLDFPFSASATTYKLQHALNTGVGSVAPVSTGNFRLILTELMV